MPSDARSANRRLLRAARPLSPQHSPYYMHNPRPGVERYGPGWYWLPAGVERAEYLGVNHVDAEIVLRELVAERRAELDGQAPDDEPAGAVVALPRPMPFLAAALGA